MEKCGILWNTAEDVERNVKKWGMNGRGGKAVEASKRREEILALESTGMTDGLAKCPRMV